MKKKRYSPEQVIRKLREAEALKAQGKTVAQICQALEMHCASVGGIGHSGIRQPL